MSAAGRCKAPPGVAFQGLAVRQESGQFICYKTGQVYLLLTGKPTLIRTRLTILIVTGLQEKQGPKVIPDKQSE